MLIDEYKKIIENRLSKARFTHSLNVSKEAVRLAKMYEADVSKAEVAGLLHDITKEISIKEHLDIISKYNWNLSEIEKLKEKLLHSISGMLYLKNVLKIQDQDLLNAVLYHTTARENMSILEKVVFVADFISEDRDYDGVEQIRKAANLSLESAMIEGLSFTIKDLVEKGSPIATNTFLAYNEVIIKENRS